MVLLPRRKPRSSTGLLLSALRMHPQYHAPASGGIVADYLGFQQLAIIGDTDHAFRLNLLRYFLEYWGLRNRQSS